MSDVWFGCSRICGSAASSEMLSYSSGSVKLIRVQL